MSCAFAVVLTTTACGSSGGSSASDSGSGASSADVITIKDFKYTDPASVAPGAKITVKNLDSIAHTVTADSGGSFDDQSQPGNSTFTAPTKPGTYPYHCTFHPEMHGTLVVK
jgi:plastocyanin